MLGEKIQRSAHFEAKTYLLLSLLLGIGAFLTWPHAEYQEESTNNAVNMAAVPMASAPSAMQQSMQPARAWQMPPTRQFMQTRARQPVQPVHAVPQPEQYPITNKESPSEPSSRRDMMVKAGAALGGLVAASQEAQAGVVLPPKEESPTGKRDGRAGLLVLPVSLALGWVGFNILGPGQNQLDDMNEKDRQNQLKDQSKLR